MKLKTFGGTKHECIQTSKLEKPKECFETNAGMQSTKAREYFGQINRMNSLHLLASQVRRQEKQNLYLKTRDHQIFSCFVFKLEGEK